MKICRYDDDRLGLVRDGRVFDATAALAGLEPQGWPQPPGDQFIANLDRLKSRLEEEAGRSAPKPLSGVHLRSPVANPTKVIGAPVNYRAHHEESLDDDEISFGREIKTIDEYGLFLKANSALAGPDDGVALRFVDRRNDHEVELAMVIGKTCEDADEANALDYVAGYAIGLDMTVRGAEDRSLRKSVDSYAVLGPWLVTPDDISDPDKLDFEITVNGEVRQKSNTGKLIFSCRKLIAYATQFFTLHPGDVIMTGTPEGVGPVEPGDTMVATVDEVGQMTVKVRAY